MKKAQTPRKTLAPGIARVLKRLHYPFDVMLLCVRWYVAYSLSLRNLEEMMAERGIAVDHSTVHRWVIKLVPLFEKTFRCHKRPVGKSWRMDETHIRVKGQWRYLYRAVDKAGKTIDFLFRAKRDKVAARRFFEKSNLNNVVEQGHRAIKRITRPTPEGSALGACWASRISVAPASSCPASK